MALRVCVVAACSMLVLAGVPLGAEPQITKENVASPQEEQGTELTAEAGLVITTERDQPTGIVLRPAEPYIWCWVIAEPIPLYFDYPGLQTATIGEFELHLGESFRWEQFKNSASREDLVTAKAMTGISLGLANETPAVFSLSLMMKTSHFERLKHWCQNGPGNLAWITFAISLDDGAQGLYFDPGIGVKR